MCSLTSALTFENVSQCMWCIRAGWALYLWRCAGGGVGWEGSRCCRSATLCCVCVCLCTCLCVCVRLCVCALGTCLCPDVRICLCACTCACVLVQEDLRTCVHEHVVTVWCVQCLRLFFCNYVYIVLCQCYNILYSISAGMIYDIIYCIV